LKKLKKPTSRKVKPLKLRLKLLLLPSRMLKTTMLVSPNQKPNNYLDSKLKKSLFGMKIEAAAEVAEEEEVAAVEEAAEEEVDNLEKVVKDKVDKAVTEVTSNH